MSGIDRAQAQGYQKWIHAQDLSNEDSLPDVKAQQAKKAKEHIAALGAEATSTVAEVAGFAAAEIAAPFLVAGAAVAQWASACNEGDALNAALMRDASQSAVLNLGVAGFGDRYAGFVAAEQARMAAEYAGDPSSRKLMGATAARMVDQASRAEGTLPKAQSAVSAGVGDGIRFAESRGFDSAADITAMERGNPSFRARYETDPAFHMGIDAVVWRAQHPATEARPTN